jgi:hypothetical protein
MINERIGPRAGVTLQVNHPGQNILEVSFLPFAKWKLFPFFIRIIIVTDYKHVMKQHNQNF